LIQDSVSVGEDKVPLLGDIPWLGAFFRHETRHSSKTNLMIFIRPYVLRTATASNGLTQDRYEYIRGEEKSSQLPSRLVLPDMASPTLPPLSLKSETPLSLKAEPSLLPPSSQWGAASKPSTNKP
jgi:general secretion pathway protein D